MAPEASSAQNVEDANSSFLGDKNNFFLLKDKHFISISLLYEVFAMKNKKVAFNTQNGVTCFSKQRGH